MCDFKNSDNSFFISEETIGAVLSICHCCVIGQAFIIRSRGRYRKKQLSRWGQLKHESDIIITIY